MDQFMNSCSTATTNKYDSILDIGIDSIADNVPETLVIINMSKGS